LTQPRNKDARAGFTLVEALVSLAILSIALAAIGALAASNIRSGLYVERHLAEVETAQAIVTSLPGRGELPAGNLTGEIADHRWSVDAAPYLGDLVDPKAASAWSPQTILVRVLSPSGALLSFDMIRLARRPAR
jgi:general secretion pathway protein I